MKHSAMPLPARSASSGSLLLVPNPHTLAGLSEMLLEPIGVTSSPSLKAGHVAASAAPPPDPQEVTSALRPAASPAALMSPPPALQAALTPPRPKKALGGKRPPRPVFVKHPRPQVTKEDVVARFSMTEEAAWRDLGLAREDFRTTCRAFDIPRWPYRQQTSLARLLGSQLHRYEAMLRDRGADAIAQELGYNAKHILQVCRRLGIKKQTLRRR